MQSPQTTTTKNQFTVLSEVENNEYDDIDSSTKYKTNYTEDYDCVERSNQTSTITKKKRNNKTRKKNDNDLAPNEQDDKCITTNKKIKRKDDKMKQIDELEGEITKTLYCKLYEENVATEYDHQTAYYERERYQIQCSEVEEENEKLRQLMKLKEPRDEFNETQIRNQSLPTREILHHDLEKCSKENNILIKQIQDYQRKVEELMECFDTEKMTVNTLNQFIKSMCDDMKDYIEKRHQEKKTLKDKVKRNKRKIALLKEDFKNAKEKWKTKKSNREHQFIKCTEELEDETKRIRISYDKLKEEHERMQESKELSEF